MIWLIVILLIAVFGPSIWVRWVMNAHADDIPGMPGTGGELAEHLVANLEIDGVKVEPTEVGDHYDPAARMVRLSPQNYHGKSLTAVAVAAHEVGHALQHHRDDRRLRLRTQFAPIADRIARLSSGAIWAAPLIGLLTRHPVPFSTLVFIGLTGLITRMLLHLVTLPTEWDASFGKALPMLTAGQYIAPTEDVKVRRILRAAALTYFSAALADVLNIFRWLALLLRR